MNAPNPLPLLGPVGNAAPVNLGQATVGPESTFADSLSLALSGALVQPVVPVPNPATGALGLLADTLTETGGSEFLLSESSADLAVLPAGLEAAAGDISPELIAAGIGSQAKEPLLVPQASTSKETDSAASAAAINIAKDLQGSANAPIQPLVSSLPLDDASQSEVVKGEGGALSTKALLDADGLSLPEQALPQLRQNSPSRTERQQTGDTIGIVKEPNQGSLAEFLKTTDNLHSKPSSDQKGQQPSPQSLLAQNGQGTVLSDGRLSNAEHLAHVRGQTANLQSGGNSLEPIKPATFAALQNANVTEAQRIDSRPDVGPIEIFTAEPGRIDPVGSTNAKPPIQQAQPPAMQIALQVARALPQGIDRFSLQLHPAELGTVEIQLDFAEDGHVSALIVAELPETLDMLQRDSRSLERSLSDTGLQLDSGGLSFSLKQGQDQQGQDFHAFSHHQPNAYRNGARPEGDGDSMSNQDPIRVTQQRLLDIHT